MIPKLLHQIWLGDRGKLPTDRIGTWRRLNPSWNHVLWTEDTLPALQCRPLFDRWRELGLYHGAADVLRYELLARFGGFYADADSVALRPIPEEFAGAGPGETCFACWEHETARPGLIANGFLGAPAGSLLFRRLVEGMRSLPLPDPGGSPWKIVGPRFFTNTATGLHPLAPLTVYPSGLFIGRHYSGAAAIGVDDPISVHDWHTTLGGYKPQDGPPLPSGRLGVVVVAIGVDPAIVDRFLGALEQSANCQIEIVTAGAPENKAKALNIGLRNLLARGCQVILQTDVDILLPPDLTAWCLANTGNRHVWSIRRDIDPPQTIDFAAWRAAAIWPGRSAGMINCMSAANWRRTGGFDERCVNWGGEDDLLHVRIDELGIERVTLRDFPVVHVRHPIRAWRTADRGSGKRNLALRDAPRQNFLGDSRT